MMTSTFFVTGTDTDAGKTYATVRLLEQLKLHNVSACGYKPISAGCEQSANGLRNQDALLLHAASGIDLKYEDVNPIAFADPVAPHLAAQRAGTSISTDVIKQGLTHLQAKQPQVILVEGAGGWRLPLNDTPAGDAYYLSDLVRELQLPVILVVGMKLGCLNHALLTYQRILDEGLHIRAWVANQIDPDMLYYQENLQDLRRRFDCPLLAEIKFGQTTHDKLFDISQLL